MRDHERVDSAWGHPDSYRVSSFGISTHAAAPAPKNQDPRKKLGYGDRGTGKKFRTPPPCLIFSLSPSLGK
jgi:hypothetical protein